MTKLNWKIEQGSRGNLKRRFFFGTVIPRSMVGRVPDTLRERDDKANRALAKTNTAVTVGTVH